MPQADPRLIVRVSPAAGYWRVVYGGTILHLAKDKARPLAYAQVFARGVGGRVELSDAP